MAPRQCGDCTLCCYLLPVRNVIQKPALTKCVHQSFAKGCGVYHRAGMPPECGMWNCRWLLGSDTADLRRPDRSHYVIDPSPEFVTAGAASIKVVQIWVDPKHRDAHRDPALRAYLRRRAAEGTAALIRYGANEGFVLLAPEMTGAPDFVEMRSTAETSAHSPEEIMETLGVTVMEDALIENGVAQRVD